MLIRWLQVAGLVLGPALFALSPLFWVDGSYGVVGGMLIAVSTVPWVFGLVGEYERLRRPLPILSGLWLLLVLAGMFGSIAFGLQGFFEGVLGGAGGTPLEALAIYPSAGAFLLLLTGPMFPTALFVLGIFYWRTRLSPRWTAVLLWVSAAAFPLARAARVDVIAVIADLLILATFCAIAWSTRPQNGSRRSPGLPPSGA